MARKDSKSFKDGKIVGKWKRLLLQWNFLKTKEKLEEIAQDHQMAHMLLFQIQESEKGLHLFTIPPGEMGVCNKDPVLSGMGQQEVLTSPRRNN